MEKMWAGRFEKASDKLADDFNSSIHFDIRMYREDITGSMAHAAMLAAKGIIAQSEADTLIAAQNAVVAAHSLGLGSCYIGDITEKYEFHRELLKLPKYVVPAAMLCFGYPTEQQLRRPKPKRHAVQALVHENGYSMEKSGQMNDMLAKQWDTEGEALAQQLRRFCARKWNSEFSEEMSRSCRAMVEDWLKD